MIITDILMLPSNMQSIGSINPDRLIEVMIVLGQI